MNRPRKSIHFLLLSPVIFFSKIQLTAMAGSIKEQNIGVKLSLRHDLKKVICYSATEVSESGINFHYLSLFEFVYSTDFINVDGRGNILSRGFDKKG